MTRDTADYEQSEAKAISSGKKAFERAPWLFNRADPRSKKFFVELRRNEKVHPGFLAVYCVDGNGTKLFMSSWSDYYRDAPIDGMAMNANDFATIINGFPSELNLYLACQTRVEEEKMGEVMNGFVDAAERMRIPHAPWDLNIGKLETASLDEMISLGIPGRGIDFGIFLNGFIAEDKVPSLDPKKGYFIVGISSTGMHSNGYTSARHTLLAPNPKLEVNEEWRNQYHGRFSLKDKPSLLEGKTILEALQVPTADYLVEASLIGQMFDNRDIYGVNITGNGLHNFNRAGEGVSFEITDPFEPLPIHELLVQESKWDTKTAYTKQNMGMGFAYIVPSQEIAERIVKLINGRDQNTAKIVGGVRESRESKLKTVLHTPYEREPIEFVDY